MISIPCSILGAFRYRRYWRRWRGDPRGPFAPSPFFRGDEAYLIAKAIGEEFAKAKRDD